MTNRQRKLIAVIRDHGMQAIPAGQCSLTVTSWATLRQRDGTVKSFPCTEQIPANAGAVKRWLGY